MSQWPDSRIIELFAIELPLLQAPMAGASGSQMAIAVAQAGGLGALPCAMLPLRKSNRKSRLSGSRPATPR
ncbi:2-nitropropane dioxygenase, NPD [Pseudomonas syringae pv. syringae]|nr:2-nitropropane dioxygenase, NPD [Pseudomonas syringae pv. syringae]